MDKKLTLLHTITSIVQPIQDLAQRIMPDVQITNLVDESIIKDLIAHNVSPTAITRRVCNHIISADNAGADAVLMTCSSISPCADVARHLVDVPVLKIDEPMAERAVDIGGKIGVVATIRTTLEPTVALIKEKAATRHTPVQIDTTLCRGAFEAVTTGDVQTHDRLVTEAIRTLATDADVIVLAQASMARLVPTLGRDVDLPMLTSPQSGLERAAKTLSSISP